MPTSWMQLNVEMFKGQNARQVLLSLKKDATTDRPHDRQSMTCIQAKGGDTNMYDRSYVSVVMRHAYVMLHTL